jgi:hypothetical protein
LVGSVDGLPVCCSVVVGVGFVDGYVFRSVACGRLSSAGASMVGSPVSSPALSMPWSSSSVPLPTAIQLPPAYALAMLSTRSTYCWEWL